MKVFFKKKKKKLQLLRLWKNTKFLKSIDSWASVKHSSSLAIEENDHISVLVEI